jgi:hypothetical protein
MPAPLLGELEPELPQPALPNAAATGSANVNTATVHGRLFKLGCFIAFPVDRRKRPTDNVTRNPTRNSTRPRLLRSDNGNTADCRHMTRVPGAFDEAGIRRKAWRTMKNLYSNVVASFLALAVVAGAAPAMASSLNDAQPQCGDDKKESKGGDKKDDKSNDTKPKPPVQG